MADVVLKIVMNPKTRPHCPLSTPSRIPCQPAARLPQHFGVVLGERGMADNWVRLYHVILVIDIIGSAVVGFTPTCRHLFSHSKSQCEMRLELHFVLQVPRCFSGTVINGLRV